VAPGRLLSVICWNANGLASVASSSAHCTYEFLAGHDVVMLCETKLGSVPQHLLPNHTLHTFPASRDHVSGQGLLLGVKSSLGLSVCPWNPAGSRSGAIWLRVCQNSESRQYFFSSCYIPPVGSRQLIRSSVERRLHALGNQVRSAAALGTVFLGGDFNAKVRRQTSSGTQPSTALPLRGCPCGARCCVCATNDHGRQLLAFCEDYDMALCTGRTLGDKDALSTWVSRRGTPSRVDHFLVSRYAFSQVLQCRIPQGRFQRRDSDHQPLLLSIQISATTVPRLCVSGDPVWKISWDPARRSAYAGSLRSSLAQSGLQTSATAAARGDVDGSDRVLSSVLRSCALIAGARRSCPGQSVGRYRRPNHHAPFFDGECHRAHKRYWRARRVATSAGGFQAEERRYKALIRRKQRAWQMQQLQRHLADLHQDPRVLWRTFNAHRATLPTTLHDPAAWNLFRDRLAHRLPVAGCSMPPGITVPTFDADEADRLNDNIITHEEVHAALTGLHNGRAGGASELPAEYLRYAVDYVYVPSPSGPPAHHTIQLLVPMLSRLFTSVFATSRVPESWKTALVTPLYKRDDPTNPDNYRPIAVGVPMVRLFAIVLNRRMSSYLESQCLRAQAQAGFRARRSVSHNLFALQHAIDKHTGRRGAPLYCCFVDLTAAFDSVPREVLWQRLHSLGVRGRMLGAVQALYAGAKLAIKVEGRVGEAANTHTGVRQGCPLSPTLFGVFIDALEPWLLDQAPGVGVPLQTRRGVLRFLSTLMYADDIALLAVRPSGLQQLIDHLVSFCTYTGLAISLAKTKVMQFLPCRGPERHVPLHTFSLGSATLDNVDSYKYLGVHFRSTGNPSHYMVTARDRIGGAYHIMRSKYCGLLCGTNVRLQLSFFNAIVTSTALYAGELWGCHPRTRAERKRTAQKHCKYLRSFLRLSPSTCTSSLLHELDQLSLHGQWFRSCIRFCNRILCLPEDDLYQDVLFDSAACDVGFVKGLRLECSAVGLDLGSSIDILRPIDVTFAMSQWHVAQEAGASISEDPRSCPSSGAALCTYQRWFRHGPTQEHVLGGSLHGHARSSSRAHQLLRFRLGCHSLPCVVGRRTGIPRHLRHCALCNQGVGDEKHLVFECIALSHLRSRFQHLFWHGCAMSSFMNQDAQRDVMYFVTDCLQFHLENAPSV
jgi:exonuclease III